MSAPTAPSPLPRWLPEWALGLGLCLVTATGVGLVFLRPAWLLGAVLAVVIGCGFLWVLVSALTPAQADRRCPRCAAESLVRLDPATTTGLRCHACGHVDAQASGWFLAEEEGPLEQLVLESRKRTRP